MYEFSRLLTINMWKVIPFINMRCQIHIASIIRSKQKTLNASNVEQLCEYFIEKPLAER